MMDGIKLKNGIAYNCNSNEVAWFVVDQINTKTMFENILFMRKKQNNNLQIVIYTNQWRFWSTWGIIYNGDFYNNTGSLDGNEMIRQFIDVISSFFLFLTGLVFVLCDCALYHYRYMFYYCIVAYAAVFYSSDALPIWYIYVAVLVCRVYHNHLSDSCLGFQVGGP